MWFWWFNTNEPREQLKRKTLMRALWCDESLEVMHREENYLNYRTANHWNGMLPEDR